MLIHVLTAYPSPPIDPSNFCHLWLRESAALDSFQKHQLTDDPDAADMILFAESHFNWDPYMLKVLLHPVYRRHRQKCFVYHDSDFALPIMRGIYPSIRRRDYQPDRCRAGAYIARINRNAAIRYEPGTTGGKWLYTFFGERNSPVRAGLFRREHPKGLVRDTTGRSLWGVEPGPQLETFTGAYAQAILDSRFVLCPAGIGPSSYRLYETMEMGRVPVILSDDWVPPPGPRWSDFSLHLPESSLPELESLLIGFISQQPRMAQLAREEWQRWFDKPVCFHHLVEACLEVKNTPASPSRFCAPVAAWPNAPISGFSRSRLDGRAKGGFCPLRTPARRMPDPWLTREEAPASAGGCSAAGWRSRWSPARG